MGFEQELKRISINSDDPFANDLMILARHTLRSSSSRLCTLRSRTRLKMAEFALNGPAIDLLEDEIDELLERSCDPDYDVSFTGYCDPSDLQTELIEIARDHIALGGHMVFDFSENDFLGLLVLAKSIVADIGNIEGDLRQALLEEDDELIGIFQQEIIRRDAARAVIGLITTCSQSPG